ncbi:MAG TPA: hypothetical protein VJV03_06190 [Pyrinomonadaceae bacterium]|nr:hypothetical protein [Pyrinomonadaceae bacterium]
MRKKRVIKKHSVRANLHVVELTRAGTSLDLEIYAENEKIGTLIIGQGSLSWRGGTSRQEAGRRRQERGGRKIFHISFHIFHLAFEDALSATIIRTR